MKEKNERKPDVSARKLKAAGYRYKLKELTAEEKKIQREGVKEIDPKTGKTITYPPPDLNYYYKVVDQATVRIFKVGDRFYYKNSWFRYMDKLPALEALAKQDHIYEGLQAQVVNTTVIPNMPIQVLPEGYSWIQLMGGPMDGTKKPWKISFPSCMIQFVDVDGKTKSARYQRDMPIVEIDGRRQRINDRNNIYNFKGIIE